MDASPLIGTRTGVGVFVAELSTRLAAMAPEIELIEYTLSFGAKRSGTVRGRWIPLPGGAAPRLWRTTGHPRIERFTGPIDVVHGTNYVVPPARARRVVSVYDLSYVHDRSSVPRNVARFDRAVRWAIERGATVHSMSQYVAAEIRERYEAPDVVVVPGGVTMRPGPEVSPEGPPVILALGATARRKRIPLLVEAFGEVAAVAEAVLRIVGPEGDDEQAVTDAVQALPPAFRSRVTRVGLVDDATRDHELASAAVLAFPSGYEGFGFPVLEAMAVGTPVVTTGAGSLAEVAGDAAMVVTTGDVDAMGAALLRVITDEAHRTELGAAGLERAALYSWDNVVEGMIRMYDPTR